jgi:hypothetical protein
VVVGVEGRKPHDAAEAALHAPHPFHRLRVESADGAVERDAAEDLDARDVLARKPRAIGGQRDVALEDDRLHLARGGQGGQLVIVHRTAEDVWRGMRVKVDEAANGADGRRRRRVALDSGVLGGFARRRLAMLTAARGRGLARMRARRGRDAAAREPGRGDHSVIPPSR